MPVGVAPAAAASSSTACCVERRLLRLRWQKRLHLGLVRQVGDDVLVGLQPPQDVGPHQLAQRAVGVVRAASARRLVKPVNCFADAEQARD